MKFLRTVLERIRHGYRIADDCYLAGGTRDSVVVECKGRKIEISLERLAPGNPNFVLYPQRDPRWLPPHEREPVSDAEYRFILDAVIRHFEKRGDVVEVQWQKKADA